MNLQGFKNHTSVEAEPKQARGTSILRRSREGGGEVLLDSLKP